MVTTLRGPGMTTAVHPAPPSARREAYEEQGFLVAREVFSRDEMSEAAAEAERLVARSDLIDTRNLRCRWQPRCEGGECIFETFDPVIDLAPVCAGLARHPRLLAVLDELYGGPARLFKDKLIFKPPGA